MRAYPTDLRERVVSAGDAGDAAREQIAALSSSSVARLRKPTRQRRETGSIAPRPRPRAGGRAPAFGGGARRLREAVRERPDATPAEPADAAGVACCPSAVHRALKRLGITRGKRPGGRPSRAGPS